MTNFVVTCLVSMVWIFGMPGGSLHQEQAARFLVFLFGMATLAAWQKWREKKGHSASETNPSKAPNIRCPGDWEDTARDFHDTYEAMAPYFGYKTRAESAVAWEQVPLANRRLMIAVACDVGERLVRKAVNACGVEAAQISKVIIDHYRQTLPEEILKCMNERMMAIRNFQIDPANVVRKKQP